MHDRHALHEQIDSGISAENREYLKRLRPIDDEFMRVIYKDNLPLAQETLRIITGLDDLVLIREETQRDLKGLASARSAILDVYGIDSRGRHYDLEVQRSNEGAQPKRARYNSAAMDIEALEAGNDFSELPEQYVVFVTESDFFGRGAGTYRFDRRDDQAGIALEDGAHVIYANGRYRGDDALGALMHDFACSDPDDMLTPALAERTRYLKDDPRGGREMSGVLDEMKAKAEAQGMEKGLEQGIEQGMAKGIEQGMAKGMEKGMAKGMEKGKLQALAELVRDGALPLASAADRAGLTPDDFAARAAREGFAIG